MSTRFPQPGSGVTAGLLLAGALAVLGGSTPALAAQDPGPPTALTALTAPTASTAGRAPITGGASIAGGASTAGGAPITGGASTAGGAPTTPTAGRTPITPTAGGAASAGAVVAGRVVDDRGRPLQHAVVAVRGTALGAPADSTGRFVIGGVPPGEHVVTARAVGFDFDVAFLRLQAGDSVDLLLELGRTAIPISGAGHPLPHPAHLYMASALLPQVLDDPAVRSLVREAWAAGERPDTLDLWAIWLRGARTDGTWVIDAEPALRVVGLCTACAGQTSPSVEGGSVYTAGVEHVRLGVTAGSVGTPRLTFCLDHVRAGDRQLLDWGCSPTSPSSVTFVRRGWDDWVTLDPR